MTRGPESLTDVAKIVIEAALDAELAGHLAQAGALDATRGQVLGRRRHNARNGSRRKTVRTSLGDVEIDAPRDRWGTFQPVTVGKWRREGPGIDRVLLPLAAKGTPPEVAHRLLSLAYAGGVSTTTLHRVAACVAERLQGWHDQALDTRFELLRLQASALRDEGGRLLGLPVAIVVGSPAGDPDRPRPPRLVSLHALRADRSDDPWQDVLADLRRRGLAAVRAVAADRSTGLRDALGSVWPGAEMSGEPPLCHRPDGRAVGRAPS